MRNVTPTEPHIPRPQVASAASMYSKLTVLNHTLPVNKPLLHLAHDLQESFLLTPRIG